MTAKKKRPMTRSENMARVKSKNTKPEIYLRKLLWHNGIRYRCNYKELPGHPDIYIPKYNTAIFVNGCFWHMHKGCKASSIPATNREFWLEKLSRNVERDNRNYEELADKNIKVIVVWECTLKKMKKDSTYENEIISKIIACIIENNTCITKEY